MRQSKRKYESDIALKSKKYPKEFWSHIRSRLLTKTGDSPLLEDVNDKKSKMFSNEEKMNILQKQFYSVFTRKPDCDIPKLTRQRK